MDFTERGNPSLLKSIREGAKKVSESRGLVKTSPTPAVGGGAYESLQRMKQKTDAKVAEAMQGIFTNNTSVQKPVHTLTPEEKAVPGQHYVLQSQNKRNYADNSNITNNSSKTEIPMNLYKRCLNDIQALEYNAEYSSAIQALFTLYITNNLTEEVIFSISEEDMNEILSILRDFRNRLL